MNNLLTIDDRTIRARKFASQIMAIIEDCVSDKDGAMSRMIDAAYRANIQIITVTEPQKPSRRAAQGGPVETPKWPQWS